MDATVAGGRSLPGADAGGLWAVPTKSREVAAGVRMVGMTRVPVNGPDHACRLITRGCQREHERLSSSLSTALHS
jgi:hypothetical protein